MQALTALAYGALATAIGAWLRWRARSDRRTAIRASYVRLHPSKGRKPLTHP